MHVKVKGNKGVKELSLVEATSGVNYAREFIGLTSGFDNWQMDIDGCYIIEAQEYEHWCKLFSENLRALISLNEQKTLISSKSYQEIYHTETRGFEHYTEVGLDNLDRITSGTVSCRIRSVEEEGGFALRKAITVEVLDNSEHGNNLELIGLFDLNTKHNKYGITVSVMANFELLEGEVEVEILNYDDHPLFFSPAQMETIENIFIKEAKRQLAKRDAISLA